MPYHPGETETENDEGGGGTGDIITQGGGEKTRKNNQKTDPKMDPKSVKKKPKALAFDGGGTGGGATDSAATGSIELVTGGVSKRVEGKVSLALHETGT